jgi:AcrR family transcriptional regulator
VSKEDNKAKIKEAASKVFARYGYDKTTLEDIGKAVNLNKTSLYYYYKNKEALFTEIILGESELYMAQLQQKASKKKSTEDKIIHYLLERIRYYHQVVNLHQLSIEALQLVEPMFHALYQDVLLRELKFLSEILEKGVKEGTYQKGTDVGRVAAHLLALEDSLKQRTIQSSGVRFAAEVDYSKVEEELKFIIPIILKGIQS